MDSICVLKRHSQHFMIGERAREEREIRFVLR